VRLGLTLTLTLVDADRVVDGEAEIPGVQSGLWVCGDRACDWLADTVADSEALSEGVWLRLADVLTDGLGLCVTLVEADWDWV